MHDHARTHYFRTRQWQERTVQCEDGVPTTSVTLKQKDFILLIITGSSIMEVNRKSGTADPQTEPDMLDCSSHIWITGESRFTYRILVQGVDFLNAMSYYMLRRIG